MLGLINDILDFSKIEAGRLELDEIEFDLRAVVEQIIANNRAGGWRKVKRTGWSTNDADASAT